MEIAKNALLGILLGGAAAAAGYLKGKTIDQFDPVAFMRSVLIGLFLTTVLQIQVVFGINLEQVLGSAFMAAIISLADTLSKIAWRRVLYPAFLPIWTKIKVWSAPNLSPNPPQVVAPNTG